MIGFPVSVVLAAIVFVLLLFVRMLNQMEEPTVPECLHSCSSFTQSVLESCPILRECYIPPFLWGRSGHVQTLVVGKVGRVSVPSLESVHHHIKMNDGATATFDVFEPRSVSAHRVQKLHTIIVVPGIANCSESKYIRTFTSYALEHGFRVAVLNHLGAPMNERLTAPRIFTYGGTSELDAMVTHVQDQYNCDQMIGVGYSMGGNVLMKYLGEVPDRQKMFICAVSVCQGYDVLGASPLMNGWKAMRRFYNWCIVQNVKMVMGRHREELFQNPVVRDNIGIKEEEVFSASSLQELDETFSRKMAGFESLESFYKWNSCCNYMHNVKMPVLMLNARDDPLVSKRLFNTPREHVHTNPNAIFVVTRHGGHLGFYEGGPFSVSTLTWMDRAIMQYIIAVMGILGSGACVSQAKERKTSHSDVVVQEEQGCFSLGFVRRPRS